MANQIVELDVRPILRRGEEPFSVIMDTVGASSWQKIIGR